MDGLVTSEEVTCELRPGRQEKLGKAFQGEAQEVLSFKTSKREISSWRERKEARVAGDQDKGQGSEGKAGPDLV